jgi:type I restriction-modification system DNA methylase subunit
VFTEQVLPRLLCAPAELLLDALPPLQPQTRFLEIDAAGGVVARPLVERIAGLGRLVTLDEIAANEHNLNIPRYVEPKVTTEVLSVEEAMKRLRESAEAVFAAEERLMGILKQEGLLVS